MTIRQWALLGLVVLGVAGLGPFLQSGVALGQPGLTFSLSAGR